MTSYATLKEDFLYNIDTVIIEPDWSYIYSFISRPLRKDGDELPDDFSNMVAISRKTISDNEHKTMDTIQE